MTNKNKGRTDVDFDGYLLNLLKDPQAVESGPQIRPLDGETLKDAFSLKEGPVPGVRFYEKKEKEREESLLIFILV